MNRTDKIQKSFLLRLLLIVLLASFTLTYFIGSHTLKLVPTVHAVGTVNTVPTFHSMSVEWDPPSASSSRQATINFRKVGETNWHQGFPLWYSSADGLYRGSLVHLQPGTTYEISMELSGTSETATTTASTWSENFPIAQTITLPTNSTATLSITQSGTPNGYILYTAAPGQTATIDGGRSRSYNIDLRASYIIIRGLTLKNPATSNIKVGTGAHHVVIENNEFSGWGISSTNGAIDSNSNSSITNIIIQRNKFYNPATDTNSWGESDPGVKDSSQSSHPGGPQAIHMYNPGGSFVIRYNEIYSTNGNRYNDCIGGGENFSTQGFPPKNSDIYGNYMEKCWDNAIESEGGNENVRIWNNYMEETYKPLATRDSNRGPLYMWRNVTNISEKLPKEFWTWSQDPGGSFHKAGGEEGNDLGVFAFHNTVLQPTISGASGTYGASQGPQGPMDNTTTRNNIFHVRTSSAYSIQSTNGASANSFDYDLYNGVVSPSTGMESHGLRGTPTYASNFGFNTSARTGNFMLASNSLGYDAGQVIPNFNSEYSTGAGPDIGAHEAGKPPMEFGVNAYLSGEPYTISGNGTNPTPFPTSSPVPSSGGGISPTPVASPTPIRFSLEAEDFTVTSSFVKQFDTQAHAGSFLTTTTGTNNSTGVSEATKTVTIPTSEQYTLWARLYGPTDTSDASYVGMDGSLTRTYPSVFGQYQWVQVFANTQLSAGQHTINLGHGEIGGRIDAVFLSNNAADVPDNLPWPSPSGMNCTVADINQDSQVNVNDYLALILDLFKSPPSNQRSDVNGDSRINALDFGMLVRCQGQ